MSALQKLFVLTGVLCLNLEVTTKQSISDVTPHVKVSESEFIQDMSLHQDTSSHSATQDMPSHLATQDRSSQLATQDKSPHPITQDRSSQLATQDKSPHPATQDRSSHPATQDKSSHHAIQDRSSHPATQDKSLHLATQDRSSHPAIQDRSSHPAIQDRSSQLATQDKSSHPATQDKSPHQDKPSHLVTQSKSLHFVQQRYQQHVTKDTHTDSNNGTSMKNIPPREEVKSLLSPTVINRTATEASNFKKSRTDFIHGNKKLSRQIFNYSVAFDDKNTSQKYTVNENDIQETREESVMSKKCKKNKRLHMKRTKRFSSEIRNSLHYDLHTRENHWLPGKSQKFAIAKRSVGSRRLRRSSLSLNFVFSSTPDFDRKFPCLSRMQNLDQKCFCENSKCDCSYANLTSVPPDLPANITELKITFSDIQRLPRDVFSRYRNLRSLYLSCNKLQSLENGCFNGLSLLTTLDVSNNFISFASRQLPTQVFEPLQSLKVLRMNGNGDLSDKKYPDSTLAPLTSLEELHLNGLNGVDLGPGFRNMTSLRTLSLSSVYCNIEMLSNSTFKNVGQITFLNVSGCLLKHELQEAGAFLPLRHLLVLDISRNPSLGFEGINHLLWGLRNSSIYTLIMDSIVYGNTLNHLNGSMFDYIPQSLRALVARWNGVLNVDVSVLRKLPKKLKTLDFRDTTVITDIYSISFKQVPDLETLLLNNQECPTEDVGIRYLPLADSRTPFSYSKLRSARRTWTSPKKLKRVGINIQNLKLEIVNIILNYYKIESNIEELDLCCGYFPEFSFTVLKSFQKLRYLTVRGTSIHRLNIPKGTIDSVRIFRLQSNFLDSYFKNTPALFSFLPNLSYLDLSLNHLTYLRADLFQDLDHLEYLYLDQNLFSQFDVDIFHMAQLKLLNLSNTALFQLPVRIRTFVDQLSATNPGQITIDMTDCPIQCDCHNLEFLKWMINSAAFDRNFSGYKCKYPDISPQSILDGYKDTIRVLEKECAENYPMFLLVLGATTILMFAVMGAILYRLRWKLRYLYYAAYLKFMDKHKPAQDKEFEHDVFLCYDSDDGLFVITLSRELESRGLKLLIHSRDFVAGDYIASNIVKAVTGSRKTLVVLTRQLLASTWCNYEIQMATMESVQTGRQVLVFLLKENIPNKELGVELLRYIRSNTYLPYPSHEDEGDDEIMERFYDKLVHDLEC